MTWRQRRLIALRVAAWVLATAALTGDTTAPAVATDRVYLWAADPEVTLIRAFRLAGYSPTNAIDAALRVMANTDPLAINDPRGFLEYAFSSAGLSDEAAHELADRSITRFTAHFGVMRPAAPATTAPAAGRSLNTRAFFRWQSDVYGFIMASLRCLGYKPQAASSCTEIALRVMDLFDPNSERHRQSDWRAGGPYPILHEALRILGFDPVDADLQTRMVLAELGVPGWLPRPVIGERCDAHFLQVTWTSGGDHFTRMMLIDADEWKALMAANSAIDARDRPILNDGSVPMPWTPRLTVAEGSGLGTIPSPGIVVKLTLSTTGIPAADTVHVPRSLAVVTVDCFGETSSVRNRGTKVDDD